MPAHKFKTDDFVITKKDGVYSFGFTFLESQGSTIFGVMLPVIRKVKSEWDELDLLYDESIKLDKTYYTWKFNFYNKLQAQKGLACLQMTFDKK